jgi:hypothetical protein
MEVFAFLIPITAILMPLGIVYVVSEAAKHKREALSRERIVALEKGLDVPLLDPPERIKQGNPFAAGLATTAAGLGITILLKVLGASIPAMPAVWPAGLIPMFVGLAMLVHWFAGGKQEWEEQRQLDLELRRAYIDRLRNTGTTPAAKPQPPVAD